MTDFGLTKDYKSFCFFSGGSSTIHYCARLSDMNNCVNCGGLTSYFAARVFVDNTIWIENCQFSTQFALNIASEFFEINDISINSNKTVAIPINQGIRVAFLSICSQPISIAKRGKAHQYLDIFLSTESLSKLSVAKAYSDIRFFVNVVLCKAVTDKQFSYLVLAVLQPIVNYRIQFSFVSPGVYRKWNVMIQKGLKIKAQLLQDFSDAALHCSSLYGLKTFEQIQSETKVAVLVSFSNASSVLGHLFNHRFLDLQILKWTPLNLLQFPVKLHISPVNNFLAGLVRILLDNELSLINNFPSIFHGFGQLLLSSILGKSLYFNSVCFLKHFGVAFGDRLFDKKGGVLDSCGSVLYWFVVTSKFLLNPVPSLPNFAKSVHFGFVDILESSGFFGIKDDLHKIWSGLFEIYMDRSLKDAGSVKVAGGAAVYFPALGHGVGISIVGLLSSTMTKLQIVALFLECVLFSSTMILHFDSQAAIDACEKDLSVSWIKVKSHSGICGNVKADLAAGETAHSFFRLTARIWEWFLVAENTAVSGNAYHFVKDMFQSICHTHWKAGLGFDVVSKDLIKSIDWVATAKIWHSDSHMLAGFTSLKSSNLCTYIMKVVHRQLPVAMELSDHVFICVDDTSVCNNILVEASVHWFTLVGICLLLSSAILQVLLQCFSDVGLYTVVCKEFVLRDWCKEAYRTFEDRVEADVQMVGFVRFIVELYCIRAWSVRFVHRVIIKRAGLVHNNDVVSGLFHAVSSLLSDSMVKLLGLDESFAVNFGYCKLCCFFSGLDSNIWVNISV
ncbi:hypothetical protein G9A89_017575 [Geosiphon pyriformis]|nr:hypothetical protein G9A89_017575 [Geosiphon pyriformis]